MAVDSRTLWIYAHGATILSSALLFLASFLCVLLWQNNIIVNEAAAEAYPTFTAPVTTFTIVYGTAIFGIVWNAILFITLQILERDVLPISTTRLRYEVEKAACLVGVIGNALYAMACIALLGTLAQLAANSAHSVPAGTAGERATGQAISATMSGFATISAVWTAFMDGLHMQSSQYRRIVKEEPVGDTEVDGQEKVQEA